MSEIRAKANIMVRMRKQYLPWMIGVFGVVGTVYGTYSLIYNYNHGRDLAVLGLVLLLLGAPALLFSLAWSLSVYLANKKKEKNASPSIEAKEEKKEPGVAKAPKEEIIEPVPVVTEAEPEPVPTSVVAEPEPESEPVSEPEPEAEEEEEPEDEPVPRMSYRYSPGYSASAVYVKLVGYGPLLRIEGSRILDMRNSTYYRIEGNTVMQEGYGIRYEIRGNQIRDAFGGYLYEYSGGNINKVFGGFYASVSGSYITLFDLSQKYEMTDSLSQKQILVTAALLFGKY